MTPRSRTIATAGAKALVSAGLIALVVRGVDIDAVVARLRTADAATVLAAAVIIIAISVLQAQRWRIVLARIGHAMAFVESLKLVLIGYFFNQTLPSTVGGDAYRAWGAYRRGIRGADAVTSVLVDRIFALFTLVLMIVMGLWWLFEIIRPPAARGVVALVIAGAFVGMAALLGLGRARQWLQRWRATRVLLRISEASRALAARPGSLAAVIALTLATYVALSYTVHLLALSMQVELGLANALLLLPLVTLVTVLPISIAGWGLRESAMVVALGLVSVPGAQAFSLSVLYGLVVMASGIPGGVLWLLARRASPPSDGPSALSAAPE